MMLENSDMPCRLAFNGEAVVKKSSKNHASVLRIFLFTLKKILETWRIPTCNESLASKKSSLSAVY